MALIQACLNCFNPDLTEWLTEENNSKQKIRENVKKLPLNSCSAGASCVFQWEMWSFLLVFGLLCWGSHGSVTCKDDNNAEVDWWENTKHQIAIICYKLDWKPANSSEWIAMVTTWSWIDNKTKSKLNKVNFIVYKIVFFKFFIRYILYKMPNKVPTPSGSTTGTEYFYMDSKGRNQELNNINSANSVLGNTLRHLFKPIRNMVLSALPFPTIHLHTCSRAETINRD